MKLIKKEKEACGVQLLMIRQHVQIIPVLLVVPCMCVCACVCLCVSFMQLLGSSVGRLKASRSLPQIVA